MLAVIIGMLGCAKTTEGKPEDLQDEQSETPEVIADEPELDAPKKDEDDVSTADEADLKLISVYFETDDILSQAIVHVVNDSERVFDANVHVTLRDASNKRVGSDTIWVEALNPGNSTYARISVGTTSGLTLEHSISKPVFSDAVAAAEATLDETLSQALTDDMYSSFGDPEWGADWYEGIEKYEVFTTDEGDNYAIVTVNTTNQEHINTLGNCVYGNYSKEYELAQVSVKNAAGETFFTR